eukprot:SAG25_NODE_58_length_18473_cov_99.552846_19_plen_141_part_00
MHGASIECRDSLGHFCDAGPSPLLRGPGGNETTAAAVYRCHSQTGATSDDLLIIAGASRCSFDADRPALLVASAASTVVAGGSVAEGWRAPPGSICPHSCRQCPGWEGEGTARLLWGAVRLIGCMIWTADSLGGAVGESQ